MAFLSAISRLQPFELSKIIGNHAVFRLREDPASIIVTDRFKDRVEKAGLNGFFFAKIWPLAADEKWEDLETRQWKADRQAVQTLKGQCITILLSTSRNSIRFACFSGNLAQHGLPWGNRLLGNISWKTGDPHLLPRCRQGHACDSALASITGLAKRGRVGQILWQSV